MPGHGRGRAPGRARRGHGAGRRGRRRRRRARAGGPAAARPGPRAAGRGRDPRGPRSRAARAWPSSPPATRSCRPHTRRLLPGQVRDATASRWRRWSREAGGAPDAARASSPTTRRRSTRALRAALPTCDLVVVCAGLVGRRPGRDRRRRRGPRAARHLLPRPRDHARANRPLLAECGGVPVIGLPGNPLSALVVFRLVGAAAAAPGRRLHDPPPEPRHARAARPRGAVGRGAPRRRAGRACATAWPSRCSGTRRCCRCWPRADGYVVVPEAATGLAAGTEVDVTAVWLSAERAGTARSLQDVPADEALAAWRRACAAGGCPARVPAVARRLSPTRSDASPPEPIWARRSSPAFDAAAMDGIAVRADRHRRGERDHPAAADARGLRRRGHRRPDARRARRGRHARAGAPVPGDAGLLPSCAPPCRRTSTSAPSARTSRRRAAAARGPPPARRRRGRGRRGRRYLPARPTAARRGGPARPATRSGRSGPTCSPGRSRTPTR